MSRDKKIVGMNKKHLTKEEIRERQKVEQGYKVSQDELTPLNELSDVAKAEFERIKKNAFWLDNLDRNDLSLYCFYLDRIINILQKYESEVVEIRGKPALNPLHKALLNYHKEMRAVSSKLGISSIDRLKLMAPAKEEEENPFAEFLR